MVEDHEISINAPIGQVRCNQKGKAITYLASILYCDWVSRSGSLQRHYRLLQPNSFLIQPRKSEL